MRGYSLIAIAILFCSAVAMAESPAMIEEAKQRCAPITEDEPILYADQFHWGMTLEEMGDTAERVYQSGKRLKDRAYYDPQTDQFLVKLWNGENVILSERILLSVKAHIEEALRREYAQYVMFPDMGHSHFFIEQKYFEEAIAPLGSDEKTEVYRRIMSHPGTKVLYHTAEQLQMIDDEKEVLPEPFLQWRYYTRNIVGENFGQGHLEIHKDLDGGFNTVRNYEGYRYWGAGFSINASSQGCFHYEMDGQKYYFDFSLQDVPPAPSGT